MRFFLDNDVDVGVCRLLRRRGHECWGAGQIGMGRAIDDEITVYGDDREATVVSHDGAFAKRRMKNTIGRHLWLDCEQPDAIEILAEHFTAVVAALESSDLVVVKVSREGVVPYPPHWK